VEGKEDPFWDEVLKEVEWDQRKDDLLDAETIARFGKLKAARILLYGTVREAAADPRRADVEVELHASSIETKQHLWGTILAKRIYYGTSELTGIIDLDPSVRRLLAEAFDEAAARVRASEKLKGVHSVALVPLAGDIDKFVTGLAEKMLNATSLYPKQLDVLTLGEARALLRDKPQTADAVLYGAVRDLSRKLLNRHFSSTNYEINASVQLTVQSAATGEVLYSDIVDARGEDVRRLSLWEMILLYKRELIWIAIGAGALILLLIFRSATRRVR
jgi:hypothetical protein